MSDKPKFPTDVKWTNRMSIQRDLPCHYCGTDTFGLPMQVDGNTILHCCKPCAEKHKLKDFEPELNDEYLRSKIIAN